MPTPSFDAHDITKTLKGALLPYPLAQATMTLNAHAWCDSSGSWRSCRWR